jgi:hypothetical protein
LKRRAASRKGGGEVLVTELTALSLRLRAIYATAVTAQLALRCQAAEQDLEIAEALRAGVCDALGDRIRELGDIMPRYGASRGPE